MNETKAKARIAAVLAINTDDHKRSTVEIPSLEENYCSAMIENVETANTLGFLYDYMSSLHNLNVEAHKDTINYIKNWSPS